ncbi:hypothetical protein BXY70_3082 [Roseovarius halotolerans]|uniref:Uncharacterized protein n=1 Tax=Roseovarius halotolerans TaxID=505353 RepID=A0A1X6ZVG6_9RHOB|nr:hypothetical protein [Roseovarius halotolerans]RKT27732.1 hypothetical protein BXY70_3082 [Roseovarius halotolerans]SLN62339.1 hypothetical protein ROH8110_03519 [Roseovarius halotolerans]
MKNEWILDVLADLEAFARQNGLPALARQLGDTRLLAVLELTPDGNHDADGGEQRARIGTGADSQGLGKRV